MSSSQPWIRLLIMNELKKIEPSLDLLKFDKRILEICTIDFKNYVDYLREVSVTKIPPTFADSVEVQIDIHTGEFKLVNLSDELEETSEFITVWTKWWWKKYKERVKLTITTSRQHVWEKAMELQKEGSKISWKLSEKERKEIIKAMINTLIKNGEICCSKIIAESLFKITLTKRTIKEWNQEAKINLMVALMKDVKRMSRTHGPLVFIKTDKKYYRLREFRDDGTPKSI